MSDAFTVKNTLDQIISILNNNPNHVDYNFLQKLALELQSKLEEGLLCDFCKHPCGNETCPVQIEAKKSE